MDTLLKRDVAPYVDFGVWGSQPSPLAEETSEHWTPVTCGVESYAILRSRVLLISMPLQNVIISWSLHAVGLGSLLDCSRLTNGYASRYGSVTWPLLYQFDVRCWLEHMERLRRVSESRTQPPPEPFDRARPWDSVWSAAVDDPSDWHKQFEEPSLTILTKTGKLGDVITGEAPQRGPTIFCPRNENLVHQCNKVPRRQFL